MTVEPFSLALDAPLSTADATIEERSGFLCRYEHRRETGLGEATPLPGWTESSSVCRGALTDAVATAADEGHESALLDLEVADAPAARHGFATALLDADARAEGEPLHEWLAPDREPPDSVPVNATVGDAGPAETADEAARIAAEGFPCVKVKVGARSLDADLERCRRVRDRLPPDCSLRCDANGAWDRATAERAIAELAALDAESVEQPLPADDLEGMAALSGGPVPVAADEALVEHRAGEVLDRGDPDRIVVKPMVLGGPGTAHTIANRALEAGVTPVVTTTVDAVVARTAAVHVAAALPDLPPCGLATAAMLAEDLGPDPAPVADGAIAVPDGDGLGIDSEEVST